MPALVLLVLAGCGGEATGTGGEGPTRTCEGPRHEWATWAIRGSRDDGDRWLGDKTVAGDVDGDGMADLLLASRADAPWAYLVLGATLATLVPGSSCTASEIADYRFALDGTPGRYESSLDTVWVGAEIRPGAVYIGNPVTQDEPVAYRVPWSALEAAGPGDYAPGDVADVAFRSDTFTGRELLACDLNGDGADDLVSMGMAPEYVALGPFRPGEVDLPSMAAVFTDGAGDDRPQCSAGACNDLSGDGIDDLALGCVTRESPSEPVVNVYYGGSRFAPSLAVDVHAPDVRVPLGGTGGISMPVSREAIGDWSGDGHPDLATYHPDEASQLHVFIGAAGFRPSGTTLVPGNSDYAFYSAAGDGLGFGVSLLADIDTDGRADLAAGDPGLYLNSAGRVHLVTSHPPRGKYDIDVLGDLVIEGQPDGEAEADGSGLGEALGAIVLAGPDVDGNGWQDLAMAAPNSDGDSSWLGAVYVLLQD